MKHILSLFLFSLLGISSSGAAVTDSINMRITYDYYYHTLYGSNEGKDHHCLDIVNGQSRYFSLKKERRDQISDSLRAIGVRDYDLIRMEKKRQGVGGGCTSFTVFKNFPKPDQMVYTWETMKNFRVDGPMPEQDWELLSGDTVILGYDCQKARTTFRGVGWTAWYTMDIPVSDGPWKLCGLPGLILFAQDDEKLFRFECVGMESGRAAPVALSGKDYNQCTLKYLLALMKLRSEDFTSFTGKMLNTTAIGYDKYGRREDNSKNRACMMEKVP